MVYTVRQAKDQLSRLLKEAAEGKEVIVVRGKKPVAKIVAVNEPPALKKRVPSGFENLANTETGEQPFRMIGAYRGQVHADDSAFAPLSDEELAEYGFGFMLDGELVPPPESK